MLWASSVPHAVESRIIPSDIPGKENQVRRKPVGVVSAISPWNWPLHLSNRTIAPALAMGNAVTGRLLLAKIFEEAGLSAGLLSVVVGAGSEIGDAFVSHPVPRVSFTGSTPGRPQHRGTCGEGTDHQACRSGTRWQCPLHCARGRRSGFRPSRPQCSASFCTSARSASLLTASLSRTPFITRSSSASPRGREAENQRSQRQ
jgi:hypothetical protein